MKKKLLEIVLALFCLILIAVQRTDLAAEEKSACESFGIQRALEKKQAPLFSLKDIDGKEISLSGFGGKAVLIVFWATW
jgi:hypothetical protein